MTIATWSRALTVLFACGACEVGEPVIGRFPPLAPEEPPPTCEMAAMMGCNKEITLEHVLPAALPLDHRDLSDQDMVLEAEEPREVLLEGGATLRDVRVRLEGPVTLILRGLSTLSNVQIASASREAELRFEDVSAEGLIVGDGVEPFAGSVLMHESRMTRLSMVTASLELDATMIAESFVAAESLDSGDGFFRGSVLEVGDALFAPARLESVRIARCGSLSFFGGTIRRSLVPRCTGAWTRLYAVVVMEGALDGMVRGDGGRLSGVKLGRFEPSEYQLWGVAVGGSDFCDHAQSLKSTYGYFRTNCTEAAFGDPDDVCNLHEPDGREADNCCAAVALETECPAPLPDRDRTVPDYWL